jgi:cytoskeletal protein RodZ
MDWMTGSDANAPDSIETMGQFQQAERSSNLMVWVLVGMNVLLAVVVALVILTRNPSTPEAAPAPSPDAPTDTSPPPPAASQSPVPSAGADTDKRVTVADAGRSWDEPSNTTTKTPSAPQPQPAPQSAAITPAPNNTSNVNPEPTPSEGEGGGVVSFFGIKVDTAGNTALSPKLADELNQRMQKAVEADKAGRYADALKLLKQIKADLPQGVTAEGLDESIAALQQRVDRQEIVKFLGQ